LGRKKTKDIREFLKKDRNSSTTRGVLKNPCHHPAKQKGCYIDCVVFNI
jgi:hypothetical protein